MNTIRRNIPNLITCLNILSGCVAIVLAFRFDDMIGGYAGWRWACLAIAVAAVADFMDGFSARLLHSYSELGKQLDSLSDLVSFGVAPAMLLMNMLRINGQPEWLCWLTLLIPVGGALRLARFNIDTRQTESFIGLPIPANAIFWMGWVALGQGSISWATMPVAVAFAIIIETWLMVSNLRLFSLKFKNIGWKGNESRWILAVCSIALVVWLGLQGLFAIICVYLLLSVVMPPRR